MNFYYGWTIVGISVISLAFWFGFRSVFSVFYVVLLEEFHWGRAQAAGVQSLALIMYTMMSPLVGGLIDRFGPRRVIVPGILLVSIGLFLCGSLKNLFQFYLFYGLIAAAGVTCIGVVAYAPILAHWFERKRGIATGFAGSGIGVGIFVLVPVCQYVISAWGWRLAFVVMGALTLIILLPLNGLLLRHKPQELGLAPDGSTEEVSSRPLRLQVVDPIWAETDWTLKRASREVRFWALLTFPCVVVAGTHVVIVHHVRFLVDLGIDATRASYVFAAIGLISSAFRIIWGWVSDRIGREITFTLGATGMCLGIASLSLLQITDLRVFVYAFLLFFGTGWGVTAPIFMSTSADLFQGRTFGLICGLMEGMIGVGAAFGTWVAGFIFDRTQSYQWAFVIAIFAALLSSLLMWISAPRKVRRIRKGSA